MPPRSSPDRDHLLRVTRLEGPRLGEAGGEPLVGLLAHRARVEDDYVGRVLRPRLAEPERLEACPLIRSESCAFIWQPNVETKSNVTGCGPTDLGDTGPHAATIGVPSRTRLWSAEASTTTPHQGSTGSVSVESLERNQPCVAFELPKWFATTEEVIAT